MKKDSTQCDKAKFYGMTLLSFHTGAALSLILYMTCGLSGVWLCLVPAFYAIWLISADRNTAADTPAVTRSTASDGSSFRNLSYKKKEAWLYFSFDKIRGNVICFYTVTFSFLFTRKPLWLLQLICVRNPVSWFWMAANWFHLYFSYYPHNISICSVTCLNIPRYLHCAYRENLL